MFMKKSLAAIALATATMFAIAPAMAVTGLTKAGTYQHQGDPDDGNEGGAEIVAYDKGTKRLFVVNAAQKRIDVLNAADPANLTLIGSIDTTSVTGLSGGAPNSVDVYDGLVAIAIEAATKQDKGVLALFGASDLAERKVIEAGALPDMVTFSPDGNMILVANEGEPNKAYTTDPEGSITIVDISEGYSNAKIKQVALTDFNAQKDALIKNGVRIFGPNATVAQDLEPEYITVSGDSKTAWVAMQEANAFAEVDIANAKVTGIYPLGFKDHSVDGNGYDSSDKDDKIDIKTQPTLGMYMPDAIASFSTGGKTYILTANEGDSRDYDGYSEEVRVEKLTLDETKYPTAVTLQEKANLGRLKTTTANGDADGDGKVEQIYSYGARSFSIWETSGLKATDNKPTFDSADEFEQQIAAFESGKYFADNRSDDKGSEPEAITVGQIGSKIYAFVGLERVSGIMIYDITDPAAPKFVKMTLFTGDDADISPEGVKFISSKDSPDNMAYLAISSEVSSTTTMYAIEGSKDSDGDGSPDTEDSNPNDATSVEVKSADGSSKTWGVKTSKGNISGAKVLQLDDPSINNTNKPSDYNFVQDAVSYEITGLNKGDSVQIDLTYPTAIPAGAKVYKLTEGGYFAFDATISGNVATITLVDGGNGDEDGEANGVIVDPVTIGESTAPATTEPTNSNSGSGNFGFLLLGLMAMLAVVRRRFK